MDFTSVELEELICFLPPHPDPPYEEISAMKPIIINIQSQVLSPPGKDITYIKVVHGRNIIPRIPINALGNARLYTPGLSSQYITLKNLGPRRTNNINESIIIKRSIVYILLIVYKQLFTVMLLV